jgi:hypothetical protein
MDPIARRQSAALALDSDPPAGAPPTPPRAATAAQLEGALAAAAQNHDRWAQRQPASVAGPRRPPTEAAKEIQRRLDAFRSLWTPEYRVPGQGTAAVTAQFHWVLGVRGTMVRQGLRVTHGTLDGELGALPKKFPGVSAADIAAAQRGAPTPEQLRRATQALLDHGKLPEAPPPGLTDRVRKMQFCYGIGVDCAGYVLQAFLASRGITDPASHGLRTGEDFTGLAGNPRFRSVPLGGVRPGDLVVLGPPPDSGGRQVGHNAVVHDHHLASSDELRRLQHEGWPAAALAGDRAVHVFEVDSSWGAGYDGGSRGGVHRCVWIFSEGTGQWAYGLDQNKYLGTVGPYEHPLVGFFRPRSEP